MRMTDRKSKMVSFRLSPDEYSHLVNACDTRGIRSVSELARTAVQSIITTNGHSAPIQTQVQELRERVSFLADQLEQLARQVEPRSAAASCD